MAEEHAEAHFYPMVRQHLEDCLSFVRKHPNVVYTHAYALALDYGVNGTYKFFPISQLEHEIEHDIRFDEYVRGQCNE